MSLGAGTLPDGVVDAASAVPLGLALTVLALGALRFVVLRSPGTLATAMRLGLELVLAAGLIRLAAHHDLVTIGGVGALVLLRQVVGVRARPR